ncbi:MAG: sulfite exporter TauE/SafE family protein [Planctomycetota bacterium]
MTELFILFLAAVIQAYAGFGYAIFSIPLLMLLLGRDYQSAVVVCNVTFLFQSGIMTASVLRRVRAVDVLTVGLLVPAGAWVTNATVFAAMKQPWIRAAFACAFGAYLIYIAQQFLTRGHERDESASPESDTTGIGNPTTSTTHALALESQSGVTRMLTYCISLLTGLVTGAAGVVSGTTGPPLIAYSRFRKWDEERIRVFLQPIFCWSALWSCVGYWNQGHNTVPFTVLNNVIAFPSVFAFAGAVVVGTGVGLWLQVISNRDGKHQGKKFQWYFYQVLRFLGVLMILQLIVSLFNRMP